MRIIGCSIYNKFKEVTRQNNILLRRTKFKNLIIGDVEMYKKRKALYVLLTLAFVLSLTVSASAKEKALEAEPLTPTGKVTLASKVSDGGERMVSIIVKLEGESLASYTGGVEGLAATSPQVTGAQKLDAESAASVSYLSYLESKQQAFGAEVARVAPQAEVTYNYTAALNGVAMIVPASDVAKIANLPGVERVSLDQVLTIDTDSSPEFVGATTFWNKTGGSQVAGEDAVIGVIDTGIWPEHPSFQDTGYPASPIGPIASCDFGNTAWNPDDAAFTCNNKLLGAYRFMATYDAVVGIEATEFESARDSDGHGSHTGSTAAGNYGVQASIMGADYGAVSGIAPRARVVAYKVCGGPTGSCYASDSAAAVQQAILDGVDVLNFSIGGGSNPYADEVSLAFLDAFNAGIFVAASAGNSGPGADTTGHREPWTTTVAASTQSRTFKGLLDLSEPGGDSLHVEGVSVTGDYSADVVLAADYGDALCLTPFAPGTFSGEIVVCERGVIARVGKSYNVSEGGAGGMVLYNPTLQSLSTDNHFVPSVHIDHIAGAAVLDFMDAYSTTVVTGAIDGGVIDYGPGDVMAAFSSRGGPGQSLGISKPDITAPGVEILAANTAMPAFPGNDESGQGPPGELFQAIGGTSMSSPHVAGAGLLMKDMYPTWTPAMIKSALMTTADPDDVVKEDGATEADAFDMGTGRLDLGKSWNPGLVFIESGADYVALEDELWNANYPSLYLPVMPGKMNVERTVTDVTGSTNTWNVRVFTPDDVLVRVPRKITVPANGDFTFDIIVDAREVPTGEVRFASIEFKNGMKVLTFPITLVRQQPGVTLAKSCDPASVDYMGTTDCTLTIENTTYDTHRANLRDFLPYNLDLVEGTVVGGYQLGNGVGFDGSLYGAAAPTVSVGASVAPYGYYPLSSIPITPFAMTDEQCLNFGVPPYLYAGVVYTSIGMVSNGYAVVGGCSGSADIDFINQVLPDATPPNNVLAPFWTDLNPEAGGNYYAATISDGLNSWIVLEWEDAPNWGDGELNTFQIWIGYDGYEEINFTYGATLSDGDASFLTVGAEDSTGLSGQNYYVDGTGTLPTFGVDVGVTSIPGAPGETHQVTFTAEGDVIGPWLNCAGLKSSAFRGTNIVCFEGEVNPPPP
jgi:hypothetical protein